MHKIIGLSALLVLAGCGTQSSWVKNDASAYSDSQLSTALKQCRYKEAMKKSNALMISAVGYQQTIAKPSSANSVHKKQSRDAQSSNTAHYKINKIQSTKIVKNAQQCMESLQFVRG